MGTNRYVLPVLERQRTENILRRAIQVEEEGVGVDELEVTEEHPDGLDVSLFHDESQLVQQQPKQRRGRKKSGGADSDASDSDQSPDGNLSFAYWLACICLSVSRIVLFFRNLRMESSENFLTF